jgi:hypothetical protein
MLYSERTAYSRMGRVRRAVHLVIRTAWYAVPDRLALRRYSPFRFLWRAYRRTWP